MIRLAGSTFAFGNLSLEESSKILSDMGFSYADIGGCGWSSFAEWVPQQVVGNIDDSQGEGDRIRKITEAHGLQISEFFICNFGHSVNHPDHSKDSPYYTGHGPFFRGHHLAQLCGSSSEQTPNLY